MRTTIAAVVASLLAAPAAGAGESIEATLFKTPWCGCCAAYGDHLEANGFAVTVEEQPDLGPLKRAHGVPAGLEGCHTLLVEGYVVEGHVPVATLLRLLQERPEGVRGISLPGMPAGSPGMSGEKQGPFAIQAFGEEGVGLFAVE